MKMILKTLGLGIIVITLMVLFSSCSKTADGNLTKDQQDKNLEVTAVDDNEFTEYDVDLTSVDYKEFYEQLAPHGEWLQVKPEEAGLKPNTARLNSSDYKQFSLFNLLGFNDAYAADDLNLGMVYVWKPYPGFAETKSNIPTTEYVPYSNGQWVYTDAGWYFKAPTPAEETVSHYGRWINSPTAGWLWVPGRVWAPAWVDWKQNDKFVSWAPLPPSVYIVNNSLSVPAIDESSYIVVEKKYFPEPEIYKYNNMYYNTVPGIYVKDFTRTDGIVIINNTIINRGPDVNIIQTYYGRNIELIKIRKVKNHDKISYTGQEYNVYTPEFKRYKNKYNQKFTVNEPKSFKKFDVWKSGRNENKELKKEEKEFKKDGKSDDNDMKNGRENFKKNHDNNNGKKNDGDYNRKKDDGNDNNGKKNEGNNNSGKKNDNEKQKGKK